MFFKKIIKENSYSDISIIQVKFCFIIKWNIVRNFTGVIKASIFKKLPLKYRIKLGMLSFLSLFRNRLTIIKGKELYFVFNYWSGGYYHFVTEIWRKLIIFNDELRGGTVLVSAYSPKYIFDSLAFFGIENIKSFRGNCFVNKVKIISNPIIRSPNRYEIEIIRDFIFKKFQVVENCLFERVYISRKRARSRKVANEDAVKSVLNELGFLYLELETLPLEEQINLFRQCKVLISIHGAGLVNSIFMPLKSNVIELYPKMVTEASNCYPTLCQTIGINHKFIFCERADKSKKEDLYSDDILVDHEVLVRELIPLL